ncbi:MAG: UGSC family (seleno)protein [Candidatus Acidiferrales bacterium]
MAQTIESSQSTLQRSLLTVLDPLGAPVDTKKYMSMAPRLDTLQGKTVYLVDVGFAGGYEFLEQLRDWLAQHMPETRTVLKHKPGNMFMDSPDLWAEIKREGHAVIFGVGG